MGRGGVNSDGILTTSSLASAFAPHADATTGVHGVGASTVASALAVEDAVIDHVASAAAHTAALTARAYGRLKWTLGTPDWDGAHPGFGDTVVDTGTGDALLELNPAITSALFVTIQPSGAAAICTARGTVTAGPPTTIQVLAFDKDGAAVDPANTLWVAVFT